MGLAEFIVMFRESLEIAFVVGIMLAYLHKTKNQELEKHIHLGVASGVVASLILAYLFQFIKGGFEANEPLFEGLFMVFTTVLVTWMILWMLQQKKFVEKIQGAMKVKLEKKETFGLFMIAFIATLREGVEAVLFMFGIYLNSGVISLGAGLLGVAFAVVIGILMFEYAVKFNIGTFFKVTTIILILLAAGLFSQGLHELQEAEVLPIWNEHVYDLNIPKTDIFGEKGLIGSVLKGLIGYDTAPSDLQVLGYLGYLGVVYALYKRS
ncbi:MAG: FTR1 family protein [Candidatus Micrarchaeota archaeon]|nr:FTR1 family protein [Candidatus Micrarchaeota archaeon]